MSIEVMKQALEAMEYADACLKKQLTTKTKHEYAQDLLMDAGVALRQAIAEAEKQQIESAVRKSIDEFGHKRFFEAMVERNSDMPKIGCVNHDCDKCQAIKQAEKQELVALKNGECWPEYVMEEWDYWRKQIADGDKGSAPRDWFEELAELKLVTAQPQREWVGLTDDELIQCTPNWIGTLEDVARAVEAKLKEKNT